MRRVLVSGFKTWGTALQSTFGVLRHGGQNKYIAFDQTRSGPFKLSSPQSQQLPQGRAADEMSAPRY